MIGKKRRAVVPPLIQPLIPDGAYARIEAKMRIEIPLPMPRFVICSPIHMSSAVPPVSVRMMMSSRPALAFGSACAACLNRNAYPVACAAARTTVR